VVDLCAQARPDAVALFHHDPQSSDEKVSAMADDAGRRLERAGVTGALVFAARERLAMKVGKPARPLSLPKSSSPDERLPAGAASRAALLCEPAGAPDLPVAAM